MREIKNFFRKLRLLRSKWNVLWYAINSDDKRIQAELNFAEHNLKKRISIKKKLKNLDGKDKEVYHNITSKFPAELQEGLFIASKTIRKEVEERNAELELYDKRELLEEVMKVFETYIDKKVDLAAKLSKKFTSEEYNELSNAKSKLNKALRTKYVGKDLV